MDDMASNTVKTSFYWRNNGEQSVYLTGSFTDWKRHIQMELNESKAFFVAPVVLPVGIHAYKFIVDGEWRYASDQETTSDASGNINNCCVVSAPNNVEIPTSPDIDRNAFRKLKTHTKGLHKNQMLLAGVHEVDGFSSPDISSMSPTTTAFPTSVPARNEAAPEEAAEGSSSATAHTPTVASTRDGEVVLSSPVVEETLDRGATPLRRPVLHNTESARSDRRLLIVMVGLPARGKSYIARKLSRYLTWLGYQCEVFNLGDLRRVQMGGFQDHNFFRVDNKSAVQHRNEIAAHGLDMIEEYLLTKGSVAVLDATNSTQSRRSFILERMCDAEKKGLNVKTMFVEVICNDKSVLEANMDLKLRSKDYEGMDPDQARADFVTRVEHYEKAYETITDKRCSYIKIFDGNRETQTNLITGFLPTRIVFFLMNLQIGPRPIFITRHGESRYNLEDRIGGDAPLTDNGKQYALALSKFLLNVSKQTSPPFDPPKDLCVWSSTLLRAVQTASVIPCAQYIQWKAMDEIDAGMVDGLTYSEFKQKYPKEYKARGDDKLRYRYPMGESYQDVIRRLEPVIFELERLAMPVVVVSHRAVLRCLYAYFKGLPQHEIPHLDWPLHEVICLNPGPYGTEELRHKIDVPVTKPPPHLPV